ncbi:MAG: Ig-like domain-containing protein [Nitrospirae bacterium]|nr:Ig-like domain-containing protein [Nitrospirota bacterium]
MRKTMRKILMVFLIGMFLLSIAAPVFAEIQGRTFYVDPFTGGYQFDDTQRLDLRSYYGLRGGFNFTNNVAVEAMFGFVPTETESMAYVDRQVRVWRYGLDALYNFHPDGPFVPFVSIGIGSTQSRNTSDGMPDHGRGMFNYGVGLRYFITESVAIRGDVKQARFSEGGDSRTNEEYTIGLTFVLGAQKNALPKEGDTTAPEVVCTNPGSGVTGGAIDANITATFSEEMDRRTINNSTFTVKDGTKTVTGKVTFAGTTATFNPDNDLEKGTTYTATMAAGVKDPANNAMANSYVWSFTTILGPKILVPVLISLEDSHFTFDSSALSEDGKTILNYNAKILKDNPKMKIRIAGYASASGTKEYNQTLSEKRATVVKEYLIKEGGIDRARLTKIGFGETRPAEYEPVPSDIYSEAAKANQRVLFEVIVK